MEAGHTAGTEGKQPVLPSLAMVRIISPERSVTHVTGLLRGLGIGAGLLTLGYGVYRASQDRRDWRASTAITAGLSMALAGLVPRKATNRTRLRRWMRRMRRTVTQFSRPMMRQARRQLSRVKMPRIRVQILPAFR